MAKIAFYGKLADRFGRAVDLELPTEGCTVAALRGRFEGLAIDTVRACVNDMLAGEDRVVRDHDRVDFLPPLSGG